LMVSTQKKLMALTSMVSTWTQSRVWSLQETILASSICSETHAEKEASLQAIEVTPSMWSESNSVEMT
jgi:hypothetical protein